MTAAERNGTMTKESSALLWESLVLDTLVLECNQQNNYRTISCYTLGPEHMKYDSQDDCVLIILLTGAIDSSHKCFRFSLYYVFQELVE